MSGTGRGRAPKGARGGGRRRARRGLGALGLLFAVLALGGTALYLTRGAGGGSPTAGPPASASVSVEGPLAVGTRPGQEAPDFAIETASSATFRLSSYRGQVVVLDFLAPG